MFPGLTSDLTARGARLGDVGLEGVWCFTPRPLARRESGLTALLVSRSLLEWYVRERVAASIVLEKFVPIANNRGVVISGRRDLADGAAQITWNSALGRGLSYQTEGVRSAVDEAIAQVRTEYDLG